MQDAVEHRCRQDGVAGEGLIPATERQIGSEDQGSLLVSLGYDLEEQTGLVAAKRQVSDLINDQEFWHRDRTVHCFAETALALRRLQHECQIGRAYEPHLPSALARWVLPVPDGPSSTTFSDRSTKLSEASSWIWPFGAPVAKPKSKSSKVLIVGNPATRVSISRARQRLASRSARSTSSRKSE